MEVQQLLLEEIRGIGGELHKLNSSLSKINETMYGELGVIRSITEIERKCSSMEVRMKNIEEYITKQRAYVALIGALAAGAVFAAKYIVGILISKL